MSAYEAYEKFGIEKAVVDRGEAAIKELDDVFDRLDDICEANQLKVIGAMQKEKVSAECFHGTTGYGYFGVHRIDGQSGLR